MASGDLSAVAGAPNHSQFYAGIYMLTAGQIELVSRPAVGALPPDPAVIAIVAVGLALDGQVVVRGGQGVRITAGPPPALPAGSLITNGIEIHTGETGTLTLQRGLLPTDQKMEMTPLGLTIDGGAGKVTIKSLTEITLEVAGGVSKIKLGPEGVTIEGLQIKVLAQIQAELQTVLNKVTAQLNDITSTIHMFK